MSPFSVFDSNVADGRLKQMRLIHKQGYTPDEIEDFR